MTISRAIRILLAFGAAAIVVWAFFDVSRRALQRRADSHVRPITLSILHWGDKTESQIVETLKERYEETHPDVRIDRIAVPDSGDMTAKLKTMISAGDPPDLFYLPPELLPDCAQLNLVRPVDDYVEREIAKPGGRAWFDDYFPLLIKAWRYDTKAKRVGQGPLYGLPKDFTTALFYINCDLFEKAGVDWRDIQKNGWTWDRFEVEMKKIRALSNTKGFEGREIYGGAFEIWHDTIRNFVWTFGGDFFGPDPAAHHYRNLAFDSPATQEALEMIYRVCRVDKTVYFPSGIAKETAQEFIGGNVACDGPIGVWRVPRFRSITDFKWDVVPTPYKKKEFQASQMYLTAWSMSAGSKHPDEAFELMLFLCGSEGAKLQSRLGLAIPPLQSVAHSKDFLAPEGMPPYDAQVFLDAAKYMRLQEAPSEPEWRPLVEDQIKRSIQLAEITPMQSAAEISQRWNQFLDAPLRRHEWQPLRWNLVLSLVGALVVTVAAVFWWRARRDPLGPLDRSMERIGYLFISPWVIGFLALTLGPMVLSLVLSFSQWGAMNPITQAKGVGFANYSQLLTADPKFYLSLRITTIFVLLCVPITQIAALAVAVLMNVRVKGIAVYRTIFFVPSLIVASVVGAVLWMQMYNNQYGIVNELLRPVLHLFGTEPPDWFGSDARNWAIPGFVLMTVWGVGSAMILYLAGLKGIPVSLYEAATIDGAGRRRQFWDVTLPMLSPLIFYNVIMGLIASFQFFISPMVMTKGGPNDLTLFYVLNLYRQAFEFHNMGYASAMAWVLFVLLLGLTALIFRASRSIVYYEGLKT